MKQTHASIDRYGCNQSRVTAEAALKNTNAARMGASEVDLCSPPRAARTAAADVSPIATRIPASATGQAVSLQRDENEARWVISAYPVLALIKVSPASKTSTRMRLARQRGCDLIELGAAGCTRSRTGIVAVAYLFPSACSA